MRSIAEGGVWSCGREKKGNEVGLFAYVCQGFGG
jgi:hypothetical protein